MNGDTVYVAGVDPSSYKLAVVVTTDGDTAIDMRVKHLSKTNKTRACGQTHEFIAQLIKDYRHATLKIYLEAPVYVRGRGGTQAIMTQSFIDGAIMACTDINNISLSQVNNMSWKKRVCQDGHAKKDWIAQVLSEIWPKAYEQAEGDQDLYDAACINQYGHYLHRVSQRVARSSQRVKIVH